MVSYSNVVRQPLFEFDDKGRPKAEVAAENLRKILPGIPATGHQLTIPMPGHPTTDVEQARLDFNKLNELFQEHDVIYLLTDSRESRWLPTLLGAVTNKLVLNIALGFDSYVVMRHGRRQGGESELGCYFCNDIVAPTDSLKDRTLDQQCTVTRPGLAGIASSFGVELMASIIQHPLQADAPAESQKDVSEPTSTPLGIVPHQIRGFLSHFTNMIISGRAYNQCTACSSEVINRFKERGFDFVLDVMKQASLLEVVTGLDKLHIAAEDAEFEWEEDE
jgi:ubiquitin-like modifier-activating enzyme ATG7